MKRLDDDSGVESTLAHTQQQLHYYVVGTSGPWKGKIPKNSALASSQRGVEWIGKREGRHAASLLIHTRPAAALIHGGGPGKAGDGDTRSLSLVCNQPSS